MPRAAIRLRNAPPLEITFCVLARTGPALRSAILEISNIVGERLEGPHAWDKEQALTHAAMALGALRTSVCAAVPEDDPDYAGRG
jgi:hypothetical protein